MRYYRSLAVLSFIALGSIGAALRSPAAPEVGPLKITPAQPDKPITLRDMLVVGLQARLKTEVNFCDKVAAKVHAGELPQRLVDQTFFWARQRAASVRNEHEYRPIVYFQPAMRARAKLLHLTL